MRDKKTMSKIKPIINQDGRECSRCYTFYGWSEGMFSPQPTGAYGFHSWCKNCQAEVKAQRRNPESEFVIRGDYILEVATGREFAVIDVQSGEVSHSVTQRLLKGLTNVE